MKPSTIPSLLCGVCDGMAKSIAKKIVFIVYPKVLSLCVKLNPESNILRPKEHGDRTLAIKSRGWRYPFQRVYPLHSLLNGKPQKERSFLHRPGTRRIVPKTGR